MQYPRLGTRSAMDPSSRIRAIVVKMPHRRLDKILRPPAWVERLADPCLHTTIIEALVARQAAMAQGAPTHRPCRNVFEAAERTLDQIGLGRVTGKEACRKAADALRKYNTAAECAHPSAKRG